MIEKEKELEVLREEYLRRDNIIQKKYSVSYNNLSNFLYAEQELLGQIKILNKWFKQELDKINKKYK